MGNRSNASELSYLPSLTHRQARVHAHTHIHTHTHTHTHSYTHMYARSKQENGPQAEKEDSDMNG